MSARTPEGGGDIGLRRFDRSENASGMGEKRLTLLRQHQPPRRAMEKFCAEPTLKPGDDTGYAGSGQSGLGSDRGEGRKIDGTNKERDIGHRMHGELLLIFQHE